MTEGKKKVSLKPFFEQLDSYHELLVYAKVGVKLLTVEKKWNEKFYVAKCYFFVP